MVIGVSGLLVGGAVQLGATVLLAWWGARVGRRRGGAWRHLVWLPVAGFALALAGTVLTTLALVQAFEAVASASPEVKSVLLAEGIARAMDTTLVFVALSGALYLASLVGCAIGALTARDRSPA